ncbi:uncharacterized protein LOC127808416 isoform X2 [Diospyros lotus]|uniref:uncharacterized protein LOC127808416 isoform X2 n=1 Tax=Diospyros lotus TaxID=55363 RepID=UPI00225175B9|nr:uncharacterized protein LOC127808416 isoform X2 [Diospyros lotus]
MEGDSGEFEEWELLLDIPDGAISDEDSRVLEAIEEEGGSQGMVRTDYFSLGSVGSDNRGWTDPVHPRKELSDFWPEDRKVITFDAKDSVGFPDTAEREVEVEIDIEHELTVVEEEKPEVRFEGIEEIGVEGEMGKFWSVSGEVEPISVKSVDFEHEVEKAIDSNGNAEDGLEILGGEEAKGSIGESELSCENQNAAIGETKLGSEEDKRSVVWWKVPFEFLKYCVFRFRPVWTFSVAAAVMGFLILGRRLYKMKKKSWSLQVKVAMSDKKASQFLSRAARLNEAFSVVKRVPVIRASLPAAAGGVASSWPAMSLR